MPPSVLHYGGIGLIALCAIALTGCGRPSGPHDAVGSGKAAVSSKTPQRELLFSVAPYDTPSRLGGRYQPLLEYLGERLGRPVELHVANSYHGQVRDVVEGRVDFAYLGPSPLLRAQARGEALGAGVRVVAVEPPYQSVIVVRQDSGVTSLGDLRGRTFAFGAHQSFGSHYMPRALLLEAGISLADLADYGYLDRHERVVLAVLHGDYDAGGTTLGIAQHYMDRKPGLRILTTSPPLPPLAVVSRPGMEDALHDAVRRALIEPDPQGEDAIRLLGARHRFLPFEGGEFEAARQVVSRLERDCSDRSLPW